MNAVSDQVYDPIAALFVRRWPTYVGGMLALGCTVGTLLSGIMAGAVSGWVFAAMCPAGAYGGWRLRRI